MRVTVVGAGVMGLSAAWRLTGAGHRVHVVAAEEPQHTTSTVAAAIWYPYRAYPYEDVTRWSGQTYQELQKLSEVGATGVRMRDGRQLFREPAADPWWSAAVPSLERIAAGDLPPGYVDGFRMTVPVVDTPVHVGWLSARIGALGVTMETRRLDSLDEAPGDPDIVVNCSGLGAATLVPDPSMIPVRGQVVVVEQFGLAEWVLDSTDEARPTYVVPRIDTVVLGGTAEDHQLDTAPDPAVAAGIVARCVALVPAVAGARIIAHRVGLRPARPSVRLEPDTLPSGRPVVHCYGHGGAGVTMALGCAADVVRLVNTHATA